MEYLAAACQCPSPEKCPWMFLLPRVPLTVWLSGLFRVGCRETRNRVVRFG
jgi:hypothetical protein